MKTVSFPTVAPIQRTRKTNGRVGQPEDETNQPFEALAPKEADPAQSSEARAGQREELDLQNEDSRIERNLVRARLERDQAAAERDSFEIEQTRREESRLARELEENEREQRKIDLERQAQKMEETQQAAAECDGRTTSPPQGGC